MADLNELLKQYDNRVRDILWNRAMESGYGKMVRETAPKIRQTVSGQSIDKIVDALKYGQQGQNKKIASKLSQTQKGKILDNLIGEGKDIAKEISGGTPAKVNVGKLNKILPYANKAGGILGGLGLAMDLVDTDQSGLRKGYNLAKDTLLLAPFPQTKLLGGGMLGAEMLYDLLKGDNVRPKAVNPTVEPVTQPSVSKAQSTIPVYKTQPTGNYYGKMDGISNIIRANTQGNNIDYTTQEVPVQDQTVQQQTVQQEPSTDIASILREYISGYDKANAPYNEALANYINNYNNLAGQSLANRQFYSALSGLSGNPYYAEVGKQADPSSIEANRLALMQQQGKSAIDRQTALIEMIGNMKAAQEAGLDPAVGLASKPAMQMYANINRADKQAEARQYAADMQYKVAQLRGQIAKALQTEKLTVQQKMQLRALDNKLQVAQIGAMSRPYSMGFGINPDYINSIYSGQAPATGIQSPQSGIDPEVLKQILGR